MRVAAELGHVRATGDRSGQYIDSDARPFAQRMWPWGHVGVGYLWYRLWTKLRTGRVPDGTSVWLVVLGSQFPDLVDKPLAWTFHVLPSGRSFAHSLFTAGSVLGLLSIFARKRDRTEYVYAFGLGYLSHLFADGLYPVLRGRYRKQSYLLWPILPSPFTETEKGFIGHFEELDTSPQVRFEFALIALAFVVWVADGVPGIPLRRSESKSKPKSKAKSK